MTKREHGRWWTKGLIAMTFGIAGLAIGSLYVHLDHGAIGWPLVAVGAILWFYASAVTERADATYEERPPRIPAAGEGGPMNSLERLRATASYAISHPEYSPIEVGPGVVLAALDVIEAATDAYSDKPGASARLYYALAAFEKAAGKEA